MTATTGLHPGEWFYILPERVAAFEALADKVDPTALGIRGKVIRRTVDLGSDDGGWFETERHGVWHVSGLATDAPNAVCIIRGDPAKMPHVSSEASAWTTINQVTNDPFRYFCVLVPDEAADNTEKDEDRHEER